jgi:HEPN domain-containing protein
MTKPDISEWIAKAEGDYTTALREYRARKSPNYDAACFHAQQCVEKYLKAFLQKRQVLFAKTHDLGVLLDACIKHSSLLEGWRDQFEMLSQYAVLFRYPGESAVRDDGNKAVSAMKSFRIEMRNILGLD